MSAKYNCRRCAKLAIWMYLPSSSCEREDKFYCDECVPRGCSCNIDPVTLIEDTDDLGRFYPCCEYLWDDRGFEKD